jgi:hypothetical protein
MFFHEDLYNMKWIENFPEGYWWQSTAVKDMPQKNNHREFTPYIVKVSKDKANFYTIHQLIKQKIDATESLTAVYIHGSWEWLTEYSAPHIHHKFNWELRKAFEKNKSYIEELLFLTNFMVKTGFTISFLRSKNIKKFQDIYPIMNLAHDCANFAADKFPHNKIDWAEYFQYIEIPRPLNLGEPRLWGQNKLCYFHDEEFIYIHIVSMQFATRSSQVYLYFDICDALSEHNLIWEARKAYVSLFDGAFTTNDHLEIDFPDHISKYIFNPWICREVCSFIF